MGWPDKLLSVGLLRLDIGYTQVGVTLHMMGTIMMYKDVEIAALKKKTP